MTGSAAKGAADTEGQEEPVADLVPAEKRLVRRAGWLLSISDLLWIGQAALLSLVISEFVAGRPQAGLLTLVAPAAVGFIALAGVRQWLGLRAASAARSAARAVKTRVRTTLLNAIAHSSPAASLPSSGHVAAMLGEQVDALGPYLGNFYPQQFRLKIVPLGILAATLCVSWLAAVILMVAGPVIPLFMALIGIRAKAASQGQQEELTRMSGFLLDRVRGLETLRLFGALGRTEAEIGRVGEAFRTGTMRVLKIAFLSSTVLELFSALGIAFVAVYVGFSLLGSVTAGTWGAPLTFGGGFFVLLLAPEFFAPLRAYAAAYHDRAAGLAAKEKLQELYSGIVAQGLQSGPPEGSAKADEKPSAPAPRQTHAPEIKLDHVSVTFGGKSIIRDFSLEIPSGETAILTGPSGAGKTTLLDCLLGLHRPDSGRIFIDGKDLLTLDLGRWRQEICWIGQHPRLFHGSLRANLLRADPDASTEDMMLAVRLAGAAALVESLPRGLETIIGEDGFGLSVGEKRRIALARAALRKTAGLILADEPTAGLDDQTAIDVIAGLKKMAAGRTLILATHDPKLMSVPGTRIELDAAHLSEASA
ncbi:thiol reductant ABC exporter subunit CydD [Roseibium aggregatum]|uniref:Thiol reductant ABC exporter subunit CydD n=1 Tax=Roseibium aggregatum TaxID=187304 RepID=A0A926NWZ7_9HYPH|nr:thiol reductant ABC exporter subunit CydD [Roseibium aggregatum]MBD1545328.1 thiol reductant ABC exporter subunit CydD [Roseibium aggregatum]